MLDKNILTGLADNEALCKAVKELILSKFDIGLLSVRQPNEELGQQVRAAVEGTQKVEEAFREIENYKSAPKAVDKPNPAY